jgi:hypothetical protein
MKQSKVRKQKGKNIIITLLCSLAFFLTGSSWLNQYNDHGYYVSTKELATIYGEQGLFTIYGVLGFSFIFLVYGIYQILLLVKEHPKVK